MLLSRLLGGWFGVVLTASVAAIRRARLVLGLTSSWRFCCPRSVVFQATQPGHPSMGRCIEYWR